MIQIKDYYKFEIFDRFDEINHFVSTRFGGTCSAPYDSMNLCYEVNDNEKTVNENRHRIAEHMKILPKWLIFSKQTHSSNIAIIKSREFVMSQGNEDYRFLDCDGMITNVPGICICSLAADCVPILFYDFKRKVIATCHAGWRGTVNNIAGDVINDMQINFASEPENILVAIGPSIGPDHFETGPEVAEVFHEKYPENSNLIQPGRDDRSMINLWIANKTNLTEKGVPSENIEIAGICTVCNQQYFFSHRGSGGKTGRFASGIMLRENSSE